MKKNLHILTLIFPALMWTNTAFAADITIPFAKGSFCGIYGGMVKVGDNFVLSLKKEQQLIIKNRAGHAYTVITPDGQHLKAVQTFSKEESQFWTGDESGNFKVRIDSDADGLQVSMEFCAYTGEGI